MYPRKPHLYKDEAIPLIQEAYLAGKLLAQNAEIGSKCQYRGVDGSPCAIGVLIDDERAACWDSLANGGSMAIGDLIRDKKVVIDEDEQDWFCQVQREHDQWLNHGPPFHHTDEDHEAAFKELIELN